MTLGVIWQFTDWAVQSRLLSP